MKIISHAEKKRKFWGKVIWGSAIALVLSIGAAFAAPLIGMINAFSTMKTAGAADPSALAADVSTALIGSLIAIPFAAASLVLFTVAIVRNRKFANPMQTD